MAWILGTAAAVVVLLAGMALVAGIAFSVAGSYQTD